MASRVGRPYGVRHDSQAPRRCPFGPDSLFAAHRLAGRVGPLRRLVNEAIEHHPSGAVLNEGRCDVAHCAISVATFIAGVV